MKARIASLAFPASAVVILATWIIQATTSVDVPDTAAAAATGLLTWASYVVLGAGDKGESK